MTELIRQGGSLDFDRAERNLPVRSFVFSKSGVPRVL